MYARILNIIFNFLTQTFRVNISTFDWTNKIVFYDELLYFA